MRNMSLIGPARGFTLLESVISIAILSCAIIVFLTAMSTASRVTNEESVETKNQTDIRTMMEMLGQELGAARICYLAPGSIANPGVMPQISSLDSDDAQHPSFLVLQYQVPMLDATGGTAGSVPPTALNPTGSSFSTYAFGAISPTAGQSSLITPPPYGWYDLVFKQDGNLIREANPALAPPAPIPGVTFVFSDLDGDGAYTSEFRIGRLEIRYNPPVYPAGPYPAPYAAPAPGAPPYRWSNFNSLGYLPFTPGATVTNYDPAAVKHLPGLIAIKELIGTNPPNDICEWYEAVIGSPDGVYHGPPATGITFTDANSNTVWDTVLQLHPRFLAGLLDAKGKLERMRIATTSIQIMNQPQN